MCYYNDDSFFFLTIWLTDLAECCCNQKRKFEFEWFDRLEQKRTFKTLASFSRYFYLFHFLIELKNIILDISLFLILHRVLWTKQFEACSWLTSLALSRRSWYVKMDTKSFIKKKNNIVSRLIKFGILPCTLTFEYTLKWEHCVHLNLYLPMNIYKYLYLGAAFYINLCTSLTYSLLTSQIYGLRFILHTHSH